MTESPLNCSSYLPVSSLVLLFDAFSHQLRVSSGMVPVAVNASALAAPPSRSRGWLLVGVHDSGQIDLSGVDLLFESRSHPIESG